MQTSGDKPKTKLGQFTQNKQEEQQIRIERKKVIDEINQYLSEQRSDLGIPFLRDENEASTNSQETTASSSSSVPNSSNTNNPLEEQKESEKAEGIATLNEALAAEGISPNYYGFFNGEYGTPVESNNQLNLQPEQTQAINDALELEGIDPNYYGFFNGEYGELVDPNYVQQGSMGSSSLNLSIFVALMGAVYYILRKALKQREQEDDVQKYEDGIDSLIGQGGNPASTANSSDGSSFGGPSNKSSPFASIKEQLDGVYRNSQNVARKMADNVLNQYESQYKKKTDDPVQQLARQSSEMSIMGGVQQDTYNEAAFPLEDIPSQVENSQSIPPIRGDISSDLKIANEPEDNQIREKLRQKANKNKNKKKGEGSDDEYDMA